MPPSAAMRKSSLLSTSAGDPSSNTTRRTTASGRAIRNNTTRPANYYARPHAQQEPDTSADDGTPAGFFPALTFFADAVTALPKEVMRQFTLMKEVEAKIHGPTERLGEVVDGLMQYPVPSRRGGGLQGGMMSFTAANSAMGSANVSLVNGVAPYGASGQNSVAGSQVGEEPAAAQDNEEDMAKRRQYHEMRMLTHNLLANLDEKNVVLTEANRVLSAQLARLDSVMPHVESEIPEEARLGSMTHWAYSDNRQKSKPAAPAANERNRRDVAATNSLAAAASAIHETEIAAARREAGNSATREKQGKGKHREAADSEFEDRPKKTGAKGAKGKAAAAPTGLGITNGEPVKRRKVEKSAIPPAMERQISSTGKGKAARETPRSTPATEPAKKTTKAKAPPAPPKRKNIISAQASPALASSPLHSSFSPAAAEQPASRPQSTRLRQNSSTNLRQAMVSNENLSRPASSAGKANTSKSSSRKRAREEPQEVNEPTDGEQGDKTTYTDMKREDNEVQRTAPPSRSDSSHKNSGRQSKTGTPRSEANPNSDTAMARTRSTRSMRGNADTPNAEASQTPHPARSHKRNAHQGSMSGLMKQIAPFNKSPDHRRGSNGDIDDPDESLGSQSDEEEGFGRRSGRRSGTNSRAVSRPTSSRKKSGGVEAAKDDTGPRPEDDEDTDMPNATDDQNIVSTMEADGEGDSGSPPPPALTHSPSPSLSSQAEASPPPPEPLDPNPNAVPRSPSAHSSPNPSEDENPDSPSPDPASPTPAPAAEPEDEDEDPDPDDPNEPKYCYCLRGSYGDMVGCDNPKCEREWFHLGCTDLETMPGEEESWFCEICRPRGRGNGGKGGRGMARGNGRGRGRA